VTDKKLSVQLENLMGNGLLGNVANTIMDAVGEDLLYSNR
jgi:hypothetical protein